MNAAESIPEENVETLRPKFELLRFGKLRPLNSSSYLIKGLIPANGLVLIWGPPKSGKTFWTFDAMLHVALGWEYRGRRVKQGAVVYCALEGAAGYHKRAEAFRQYKMAEDSEAPPFYLMTSPLDLSRDYSDFIRSIRVQAHPDLPVAVVIDTLNRSLDGSESSDQDMARYIKAATAIKDAFDCAVIIIHHCGWEGTRPRGHTSLPGAIETQIAIVRDKDDNIVAKIEYMKDDAPGEAHFSQLERVEVGLDENSDPITSCICVEAKQPQSSLSGKRGKQKTPKAADIALLALEQAIAQKGEQRSFYANMPDCLVVSVENWRRQAYGIGISAAGTDRGKQLAFQRAKTELLARKEIAVSDNYAWILPDNEESVS